MVEISLEITPSCYLPQIVDLLLTDELLYENQLNYEGTKEVLVPLCVLV